MRRIRNIFIIVASVVPITVFAGTYTLLSPLGNYTSVNTGSADAYFNRLFLIFIAVAAILAVIRLMICGLQYMTSEAVSSKGQAKQCIWYVIGGLFLILLSFIILQTINPGLTGKSFNDFFSGLASGIPATSGDLIGPTSDSGSVEITGSGKWFYTIKNICNGFVSNNNAANSESECKNTLDAIMAGPDARKYQPMTDCKDDGSGAYSFQATDVCTGQKLIRYGQPSTKEGACKNVRTLLQNEKKWVIVAACQEKN